MVIIASGSIWLKPNFGNRRFKQEKLYNTGISANQVRNMSISQKDSNSTQNAQAQKQAQKQEQKQAQVLAAKQAMSWLHTARFYTTAAQLDQLPPADLPEIAFVGRSNAGKSTAINTLTQQKRLAFASKTPGRTQHINLFALGKQKLTDARFADLPGYGYASVPKEAKIRWQQVMTNYLRTRENLHGIVLLIDPRHGLTELDDILLDIMRERVEAGLNVLVLLTKADKLNKNEGQKALSIVNAQVGGASVRLFSSTKRTGLEETAQELYNWVHEAEES